MTVADEGLAVAVEGEGDAITKQDLRTWGFRDRPALPRGGVGSFRPTVGGGLAVVIKFVSHAVTQ